MQPGAAPLQERAAIRVDHVSEWQQATHRTVVDWSSTASAIARVPVEGIDMSRTATVAIGTPAPAPRTRTYALPDGELAREVRP